MPDTITESELRALTNRHFPGAMSVGAGFRSALSEVGITVVPDPIPEPEGDVIVVDRDGDTWRLAGAGWANQRPGGPLAVGWERLKSTRGPVKIYRAEEGA